MVIEKMKIVHINASDVGGGAAIASKRHAEAMRQAGIDSCVLVAYSSSHSKVVCKPHWGWRSLLQLYYSAKRIKLNKKLSPIGTFSVMQDGMPLYDNAFIRKADVIFLHWINNETLSLKGVKKILDFGKPTFWYMHDMFPITGGCHHALDCQGYKTDCKDCPLIQNSSCKKVAEKQLKKKIKTLSQYKNLSFVTPSIWLGNCVENSALAINHKVFVVPNVINTNIYKPINMDAKSMFGLDPQKKTILFGVANRKSVYKGAEYAHECLKRLDPSKYEGLIIGNTNEDFINDIPMRIVETGYLGDDISLCMAYNACDTFIITSMAENYPNVVLEAMSCGKPCVGFRTGGIPDLIHHKTTGYLTEEKTVDELLQGIEWLFEDSIRYQTLSESARKQILENNSYERVLDIHKELSGLL